MRPFQQEVICGLLQATGLLAARRRREARAARILMYHGVGDGVNRNEVRPGALTRQLGELKAGFEVLALDALVDRLHAGDGIESSRPLAAVTFDDGLRGVHDHALPVLESLGIPATVFVVTDLLDSGGPVWTGEVNALVAAMPSGRHQLSGMTLDLSGAGARAREQSAARLKTHMKHLGSARRAELLACLRQLAGPVAVPRGEETVDWNAAERLAASGLVRLGSHTASHPILPLCDETELRRELADSRQILLRRFPGRTSDVFCYPNGDHDPRVAEAVRRAGYRAAVTTRPGLVRPSDDPFHLGRVGVYRETGPRVFSAKLAGWGEARS